MATTEPRLTALKIAYKGELHRVRVDLAAFQYADLAQLFAETFALPENSFVVQYSDADGDVLNVTSQAEYVEACRVFLSEADASKSLRFSASSKTQVLFQENVADPILKALEKLVESLTVALHKVQEEEWARRAQEGVQAGLEHTEQWAQKAHAGVQAGVQASVERSEEWAQKAQAGVQLGLDQTSQVLNRAAKDARESLCYARQSLQEIPFDQILKETGESLKIAADNFQTLAQDVINEMKKMNLEDPNAEARPAEAEAEAAVVPPADPEWEQVDEHAPKTEAVPVAVPAPAPEPEIVQVVAPSPEELKWATEIAKVHDIFPDIDTQHVIDNLEHCNGNVNVVLNSLMEDM